jgi:hypothetical protein
LGGYPRRASAIRTNLGGIILNSSFNSTSLSAAGAGDPPCVLVLPHWAAAWACIPSRASSRWRQRRKPGATQAIAISLTCEHISGTTPDGSLSHFKAFHLSVCKISLACLNVNVNPFFSVFMRGGGAAFTTPAATARKVPFYIWWPYGRRLCYIHPGGEPTPAPVSTTWPGSPALIFSFASEGSTDGEGLLRGSGPGPPGPQTKGPGKNVSRMRAVLFARYYFDPRQKRAALGEERPRDNGPGFSLTSPGPHCIFFLPVPYTTP